MPDYLPSTDLGLLAWGDNFASLITAAPATYGLVAGDATTIQDAFDAYETALQTALDPPTRTPVAVRFYPRNRGGGGRKLAGTVTPSGRYDQSFLVRFWPRWP